MLSYLLITFINLDFVDCGSKRLEGLRIGVELTVASNYGTFVDNMLIKRRPSHGS